jgi:NhaA family Na+:H+ antiporter
MTRAFRFTVDHYLVLPLGVCLAFAWANMMAPSYFTVAQHLSFVVNEIGMSLFFGLTAIAAAQTATPHVTTDGWRGLILVMVAAVGGMAGAGATYAGYLHAGDETSVLAPGWPIVCATDMAFACFIGRSLCRPRALQFLLLLGIVSNVIGLVVIECAYPVHEVHGSGALLLAGAIIGAIVLKRFKITSVWPYLLGCGALSWCGLFLSGLHPALAVVPIALVLNRASVARSFMVHAQVGARDALSELQMRWKVSLQIVLFLFGVTNAGVVVRAFGTGTWAVALATLAGRPAGTLLALAAAAAAGLRLPRGVGWRDMVVVSIVSGMGFTFALFFATVTLPVGPVLNEVKLGALMTVGLPLLMFAAVRLLHLARVGHRVARRQSPAPQYIGV